MKKTLFLSVFIFFIHLFLYSPFILFKKQEKTFFIPYGVSLRSFFRILEKEKIVRNSEILRILMFFYNPDFKPIAGRWRINYLKNDLFILKSVNFPLKIESEVLISIPEGMELRRIIKILSEKTGIEEEEFRKIAYNPSELREFFPENFKIPKNIEGYLFPDTYLIPLYLSPKEILGIMIKRLFVILKEVGYDTMRHKINLGLHQILTLASIVEKEALYDFEKPIIASVYYNRLKRGMPLQADPTIQYLLKKPLFPLPLKFLKIKSPYNTYMNKGLPPTPICSPGKKSIEAVLYPAETDYLYFVAKGDGRHIFSKSYREHLKNKRIAKRTWRRLRIRRMSENFAR